MSLLEIKNLSVTFEENKVVHDISFSLFQNETLAIVGESGSGKTVSALSVLGLLNAKIDGEILLDGKNIKGDTSIRGKDISMVFQEPMSSLNPLHKIGNQIEEVYKIHKIPYKKEDIIELLRLVGFNDAEGRLSAYPHELSGGQRQRVMIAMGLASNPKVLIADEPTTALDVIIQDQIISLLKNLQKKMGLSILFISHDLSLVEKLANRIAVMKEGKIVEIGETKQIINSPKHEYTKSLIDAIPKTINETEIKTGPLLSCQNMTVNFGNFTAVSDISFDLKEKETLGILGESGSGKTTLGMAVLSLVEKSGKISLNNKDITNLSLKEMQKLRKDIQVVFQDPFSSLSPRMSVFEIIKEGLDVHFKDFGTQKKEEMVNLALEDVGLDLSEKHKYPHELSGGQRQRIAIARALILNPKIIVLDEPTSALDVAIQSQILSLLKKLQEKHKIAYIFISHDMRVVRSISNRILIMKNGKMIESGKTSDIFLNPKSDYTKMLIKSAFSNC